MKQDLKKQLHQMIEAIDDEQNLNILKEELALYTSEKGTSFTEEELKELDIAIEEADNDKGLQDWQSSKNELNILVHLTKEEKQAIAEIKARVNLLIGNALVGFYLFGSKARGDYDEESDVDLAIVVENPDREIKRSIINIVADTEVKYFVVISSIIFSADDFNLLLARERRIALDIVSEGINLTRAIPKFSLTPDISVHC